MLFNWMFQLSPQDSILTWTCLSSTFQKTPQLCCGDEWYRIIFLRGLIPPRKVLDL